MLWKCCTQYSSKFGQLSSGHRTGEGQFSIQSQRKTMPKIVQTTACKVKSLSRVRLFATPWTVAYQAPLSMGFSRQEYWSGVPLPSLRDRLHTPVLLGFPGDSVSKESICNVGDLGLIPQLGRSPGWGNAYPLQYFGLENPHEQRSLAGCSPWGRKQLDTTWLTKHMPNISCN